MSRPRFYECTTCAGTGAVSGHPLDPSSDCPDCEGAGEVEADDADQEIDRLAMLDLDPWGRPL